MVIVTLRGSEQAANESLERVRTRAGLKNAYVEKRGEAFVVAYGNYPEPSDPKAQDDLKKIRNFEIDGGKPFVGAVLTPPPANTIQGAFPEYNLANVRSSMGPAARWTLQIGVYTRMDDKPTTDKDRTEFRKAAEKAAFDLRREGEIAFYFHGPNRSMVTVGVFDETEYNTDSPGVGDGPTLRSLREKFPYNLVNGAGYKVKRAGEREGRLQRSMIVNIPEQ